MPQSVSVVVSDAVTLSLASPFSDDDDGDEAVRQEPDFLKSIRWFGAPL
jgi:hypothetical protein